LYQDIVHISQAVYLFQIDAWTIFSFIGVWIFLVDLAELNHYIWW
jgi:hypothetical protein